MAALLVEERVELLPDQELERLREVDSLTGSRAPTTSCSLRCRYARLILAALV